MLLKEFDNRRYPHHIEITRREKTSTPFDDASRIETRTLYAGRGRSYTDTTTTGSAEISENRRKASIPVRFDEWAEALLDGDEITARIGNYTETGTVRDFEADNNRTVVYWELVRQ